MRIPLNEYHWSEELLDEKDEDDEMTAATLEDIKGWIKKAQEKGATHLIVVCDTFSYEDYPVYVMPGEDVHWLLIKHSKPSEMQRVMECYNLLMDIESQLMEKRAYHP